MSGSIGASKRWKKCEASCKRRQSGVFALRSGGSATLLSAGVAKLLG